MKSQYEKEFKGFKIKTILEDDKIEKIYNAIPSFAMEKGQTTLLEARPIRREEKSRIEEPLVPREVKAYPTIEEVQSFIKSNLPDYNFSLPSVCLHFLGFVPPSKIGTPERRIYDRMFERIRKAKERIVKEENGQWNTQAGAKGETIYTFTKI